MTIQTYPNGIGGTAPGDSLDLCRPLQTTGNVWYVSSLTGTDAGSPRGRDREKPLATVAQAVTNAVSGDIIVFLPGHAQTLTAVQTIAKRLVFIGEGTTSGKPAVSFTMNAAGASIFNATNPFTEFRNIYFPTNLVANTAARVVIGANDSMVRGCYFDCGANDTGPALEFDAGSCRLESSTFLSTATLITAQPQKAIAVSGVAVSGITMYGVVVDAGTVGFSVAGIDLSPGEPIAQVAIEALSLLNGADLNMGSGTTGRLNIQLATGGSRVFWG